MSVIAKIGIVGLGVIAVVVAALYFVFRGGSQSPTVEGINKDQAITTNAARDPGEPALTTTSPPFESPQRADYANMETMPALNSTSVSLAGGAQLAASLPSLTGTETSINNPTRGLEAAPGWGNLQFGDYYINPVTGAIVTYEGIKNGQEMWFYGGDGGMAATKTDAQGNVTYAGGNPASEFAQNIPNGTALMETFRSAMYKLNSKIIGGDYYDYWGNLITKQSVLDGINTKYSGEVAIHRSGT